MNEILEDKPCSYKQLSIGDYDDIRSYNEDEDLCYDVKYNEINGNFEYVGFKNSTIYTKDGQEVLLEDFCKNIINRYRKGELFSYFPGDQFYYCLMNRWIPSSGKDEDNVLPVFFCQAGKSFEEDPIIAPFYRIICIPKEEEM